MLTLLHPSHSHWYNHNFRALDMAVLISTQLVSTRIYLFWINSVLWEESNSSSLQWLYTNQANENVRLIKVNGKVGGG